MHVMHTGFLGRTYLPLIMALLPSSVHVSPPPEDILHRFWDSEVILYRFWDSDDFLYRREQGL